MAPLTHTRRRRRHVAHGRLRLADMAAIGPLARALVSLYLPPLHEQLELQTTLWPSRISREMADPHAPPPAGPGMDL